MFSVRRGRVIQIDAENIAEIGIFDDPRAFRFGFSEQLSGFEKNELPVHGTGRAVAGNRQFRFGPVFWFFNRIQANRQAIVSMKWGLSSKFRSENQRFRDGWGTLYS